MKKMFLFFVLFFFSLVYAQEAYQGAFTGADYDRSTGILMNSDKQRICTSVTELVSAFAEMDSGIIIVPRSANINDTTGWYYQFSQVNAPALAFEGYIAGTYRKYFSLSKRRYDAFPFYGTDMQYRNTIYDNTESYRSGLNLVQNLDGNRKIINAGAGSPPLFVAKHVWADSDYTSRNGGSSADFQYWLRTRNGGVFDTANTWVWGLYPEIIFDLSDQDTIGLRVISGLTSQMEWAGSNGRIKPYNSTSVFTHFYARHAGSTTNKFNHNLFGYYSDVSTSYVNTGYNYFHFYGSTVAPSWFGGNVNSGTGFNYGADAQANDSYVITLAGNHTLTAGLEVTFKANTANTDGATLQVNSLTAKALTKATSAGVNTALATGDIKAGQIVKAVYDGTQFQVISRLAQ